MEPVTHVLTGACLARTGLNRRAAYATAAMAIAAEFPDIDTLWTLRGPVSGFEHHRGITHTFFGLPFEAGLILLGFFVYDRLRSRKKSTGANDKFQRERDERSGAPVRWGTLYALLLLALLSHLFLDYTNNYGLRPFFPFDPRWYAGSFVFIFDPLLFGVLLAGTLLPFLFGFIGREIGAARERFRGRGWARVALGAVVLLWCVRWVEHGKAVAMAQTQTMRAPGHPTAPDSGTPETLTDGTGQAPVNNDIAPENQRALLQPLSSLASPDPLSIFRWYTVTDFGPAYRLGVADTDIGAITPGQILDKPDSSPALRAAESSRLGRVYLDWSPMPALSVDPGVPENFVGTIQNGSGETTVTFRDPRFMGDTRWSDRGSEPPLTGEVVLGSNNRVIAEIMAGHLDRRAPEQGTRAAGLQ